MGFESDESPAVRCFCVSGARRVYQKLIRAAPAVVHCIMLTEFGFSHSASTLGTSEVYTVSAQLAMEATGLGIITCQRLIPANRCHFCWSSCTIFCKRSPFSLYHKQSLERVSYPPCELHEFIINTIIKFFDLPRVHRLFTYS